ncbi:MAG TPA: endonuclease/exonuclease/phosphatase family protein [Phycisphaerales bacterium]|nr:endonuclease/exonuclease/phosphatase family protein [Phycisphaerales bacterium]
MLTFRAALLAIVALVLGGCRVGGAARPEPLTVMSFNIRYGTANDGEDRWEKRRGLVMDVIRSHEPDVIGLQEALRFQIDEIRKEMPAYAEVGVGRDDGKTKGEYSAILYRTPRLALAGAVADTSGTFWLSDTPEKVASRTWGNGITRVCTWARLREVDGSQFVVFNTHLDHQSEPSRRRSVELIASRVQALPVRVPVIVTGDFNCGEASPAIRFVTGAAASASGGPGVEGWTGLVDTFRVVHPDEANVRTFHAFKGVGDTTGKGGPQGALTEKIDFVFVDEGWEVMDAAIDRTQRAGRYPSDHFPVVARVRMRTE